MIDLKSDARIYETTVADGAIPMKRTSLFLVIAIYLKYLSQSISRGWLKYSTC